METKIKKWHCHAKINLYLRVLGPMPNGFHELETLFQEIDLTDVIEWKPDHTPLAFSVVGPVSCPRKGNLVLKSVDAFVGATGLCVGGQMTLIKHIPVGAGLGGGSSDAASVLMGLNQHFGYPLPEEELGDMMSHLGADVAFFSRGGTQIGRGRGDQLIPADAGDVPDTGILLFPPCGSSTANVYAHVKHAKPWAMGARPQVCVGENDLLASALACSSTLRGVYAEIEPAFRDELFFMTGSGSAFVWLASGPPKIQGKLANLLNYNGVTWKSFSFLKN